MVVAVSGLQAAVEVGQQVDCFFVDCRWRKDSGQGVTDIWLSIVANNDSVDEEGQQSVLVGRSVVLQQSRGVLVADGH